MKYVMPLHALYYNGNRPYEFADGIHSIRKFSRFRVGAISYFFSRNDRFNMSDCRWALVLDSPEMNPINYKTFLGNTESIILAFKIFCNASLFVKYRICADDPLRHIRVNNAMMYWHELSNRRNRPELIERTRRRRWLNLDDFRRVDETHTKFTEMWNLSDRTHNAVNFAMNAYRSQLWRDSFIYYIFALEALFSSNQRRGMTGTIARRVSSFLDKADFCTEQDLRRLYDARSTIVHGKLPRAGLGGWDPNILATAQAEYIVAQTMRKMVNDDSFRNYELANKAHRFLNRFD